MNTWIKVSAIGMLALSLLAIGACKTSQPGVKRIGSTFNKPFPANPEQVTEAAKAAVDELKLILISSESTEMDGKIVARTAQDRRVDITIEKEAEDVSRVHVRVGFFGDEDVSMTILEGIAEKLGE